MKIEKYNNRIDVTQQMLQEIKNKRKNENLKNGILKGKFNDIVVKKYLDDDSDASSIDSQTQDKMTKYIKFDGLSHTKKLFRYK